MQILIRHIAPDDNKTIASIIRNVLTEFGCNKPGTAYADTQTDFMYEYYTLPRHKYFIAEVDGVIAGGAGVGSLPDVLQVCELQKMYLNKPYRNKHIAPLLLNACIDVALKFDYKAMYLETLPQLKQAVKLYRQNHFEMLDAPIANTGHSACSIWMMRQIS